MGMVIHDDFWAAAQAMPQKQRAGFIYAIAEYRFEDREPEGSPAWLPTFLAIKGRLDMGDERSERARKAADARWKGRKAAEAVPKADADGMRQDADAHADACAQAHADAYADASDNEDTEVEDEVEYKKTPVVPYSDIVRHLNERTGSAYRASSKRTRQLIHARWQEGYRQEDFERVIDTMAAEWGSDPKMSAYLRPETLFSASKFEGYLNRRPRSGEVRYGDYA